MGIIKKAFLGLKRNAGNKLVNLKSWSKKFKKDIQEAKNQPRSKRKSLFLGFSTALGIFGVTLLTPVLSAVAKELPNPGPSPTDVSPSPAPVLAPSKEILNSLAGAAATICALAISSGSFAVGAACGVVVAVGILKAQGK